MKPHLLFINPPIYDFSAYDFWLKPYGLLRLAGLYRGKAQLSLFDFLDRSSAPQATKKGAYGKGKFYEERVAKPALYSAIPRHYKRFGSPLTLFEAFLDSLPSQPNLILIGSGMTYWYLGVQEVVQSIRQRWHNIPIYLGGIYPTLIPEHARTLEVTRIVEGLGDPSPTLNAIAHDLGLDPPSCQPPLWEAYPKLAYGVIQLSYGCPFQCSYCSVPITAPTFAHRPLAELIAEARWLSQQGIRDLVFYDDALLSQPEKGLFPFLNALQREQLSFRFHTPNALHVRLLTKKIAHQLIASGFTTFYLGLENISSQWQKRTGGKVQKEELAAAVSHLKEAGCPSENITVYCMIAHPAMQKEAAEESILFCRSLGVRVMLSEYSPIPHTPDGDAVANTLDLAEPLTHNNSFFPIFYWGWTKVQQLKALSKSID